jgi:hypothetical protein
MKLEWMNAPTRTSWGKGMREAVVALSKDATASIYVHEDDIPLVESAFAALFARSFAVTQNFTVSGPVDRRTVEQIAAAAAAGLARGRHNL